MVRMPRSYYFQHFLVKSTPKLLNQSLKFPLAPILARLCLFLKSKGTMVKYTRFSKTQAFHINRTPLHFSPKYK